MLKEYSNKKLLPIIILFLLIFSVFILKNSVLSASLQKLVGKEKPTIVIDVGHGGRDPGKVSVSGEYEKDINLEIALKLKTILEQNDCNVILTRDTDTDLSDANASNKKLSDLNNRLELILNTKPDLVVSIHQNAYPSSSQHGAQTFYYSKSSDSKLLAETIQDSLITNVDPDNHRPAKSNDSYYILKKCSCPIVIIECGFLSNWEEDKLLQDENYQKQLSWGIHLGILEYLSK